MCIAAVSFSLLREDGEHMQCVLRRHWWAQNGKFLTRVSLSNDHINCFFHSAPFVNVILLQQFRVFLPQRGGFMSTRGEGGVCDNVVKMFHIKNELEKEWKSILFAFVARLRGPCGDDGNK